MADKPHPSRKPLEGDAAKPENWTASPAAERPPARSQAVVDAFNESPPTMLPKTTKTPKTLLQTMASIERLMEKCPTAQRPAIVKWFATQYGDDKPANGPANA